MTPQRRLPQAVHSPRSPVADAQPSGGRRSDRWAVAITSLLVARQSLGREATTVSGFGNNDLRGRRYVSKPAAVQSHQVASFSLGIQRLKGFLTSLVRCRSAARSKKAPAALGVPRPSHATIQGEGPGSVTVKNRSRRPRHKVPPNLGGRV